MEEKTIDNFIKELDALAIRYEVVGAVFLVAMKNTGDSKLLDFAKKISGDPEAIEELVSTSIQRDPKFKEIVSKYFYKIN